MNAISSLCYPALCGIVQPSMNEQGAGEILHAVGRAAQPDPIMPGCNTSVSCRAAAPYPRASSGPAQYFGAFIRLIDANASAQIQRSIRVPGRGKLTPASQYVPLRVMDSLGSDGGAGVFH